ncbi:MAG: hypothetical protein K2W95_22065 [Candidatus Obscuribacterales bacterium]|nr:hypothetical protein [Candidatus Obscuribacterales bacterium]
MGWNRRQTECDRGSRRPRARQAERQQGLLHDEPEAEQTQPDTGHTFWQSIGIGEYEVGPRGYTGRSRMAGNA